jgi:hypothetical protein
MGGFDGWTCRPISGVNEPPGTRSSRSFLTASHSHRPPFGRCETRSSRSCEPSAKEYRPCSRAALPTVTESTRLRSRQLSQTCSFRPLMDRAGEFVRSPRKRAVRPYPPGPGDTGGMATSGAHLAQSLRAGSCTRASVMLAAPGTVLALGGRGPVTPFARLWFLAQSTARKLTGRSLGSPPASPRRT